MPFHQSKPVYLFPPHKTWILGGIVKEASYATNIKVSSFYIPRGIRENLNLKHSFNWRLRQKIQREALFMHQDAFSFALNNKVVLNEDARVYFTHNNAPDSEIPQLIENLNKAKKVFTQNSDVSNFLINNGLEQAKVRCIYGGVDRSTFYPKSMAQDITVRGAKNIQNKEFVLIVGDCKSRKNPGLLMDVIRTNPNIYFVIHGRGWEKKLLDFPPVNFSYLRFDSKLHPWLMRNANMYLSLSSLEGGPYPTLEALASGTPVLVTNTGWNKEIVPKSGGVVIDAGSNMEKINSHIDEVFKLKPSVERIDLLSGRFTWRELGEVLFS